VKQAVSLRLDADVIAWLKKDGEGYQTRANRMLRERMLKDLGWSRGITDLVRNASVAFWAVWCVVRGGRFVVGCRSMSDHLQKLIDAARSRFVSEDEREAQRRSFAYGNTKIENDRVTREMVAEQDELLKISTAR